MYIIIWYKVKCFWTHFGYNDEFDSDSTNMETRTL